MARMKTKITGILKRIALSCIILPLATGSVHAQDTIFGSSINLSRNADSSDCLPSVAAAGDNIYVIWEERDWNNMTLSPILFRSSPDKGKTWIPSLDESPIELGIGNDSEVAAVDTRVYVMWQRGTGYLDFRWSDDKGSTWNPPLPESATHLNNYTVGFDWLRRSSLAVSENNVYAIWTGQPPGYDHVVVQFRRSNDQGISWDPPLNHNPVILADHGDDSLDVDVAASGTNVYVVWEALRYGEDDIQAILYKQSTNSGSNFGNEILISSPAADTSSCKIATSEGNIYVVWGQSFLSNIGAAFRKASIEEPIAWSPPLSDPPICVIEGRAGCARCWWDVAASGESIVVVNSDLDGITLAGKILYRESSDLANMWNPSISEDPAEISQGIPTMNVWPRVAAEGHDAYVAWQNASWPWGSNASEVLIWIGNNAPLGSTLASWESDRQMNQHLASHNESPSLPLTLQWKTTLPDAVKTTPVRHRRINRVFVGSDDRQIYALDPATGLLEWNFPTSGSVSSSPTVAEFGKGELTLIATSEGGTLYSINPDTGELRWQMPFDPSPLTSAAISDAGTLYYIGQDADTGSMLHAVSVSDGSTEWKSPLGALSSCTPMEAFRTIYVGIPNNHLALLGIHGINGHTVLEKTDDEPTAGSYTSGLPDLDAVDYSLDNYPIHVSTREGFVKSIQSSNGADLWEIKLLRSGPVTGMALTQGRNPNTLVVSQLNTLYALGPTVLDPWTFTIQWHFNFSDNSMTENGKTPKPLVWGNYVFHVVDGNRLVALSLANGSEQWSYTLETKTVSSPSVDGESLYIADNEGNVYRFLNPLTP